MVDALAGLSGHPPAAAAFDAGRLAWLAEQAPHALASALPACRPGLLLTSRQGDLAVHECRSGWGDGHLPPLNCHLVVVALAPSSAFTAAGGGRELALAAGDICLVPAGEAAFLHFTPPHHLMLLGLRPRLVYGDGAAATRPAEPPPALQAVAAQPDPVLHAIAVALRSAGADAGLLADHLARAVAAQLLLRHVQRERPPRPGLGDLRLQRALTYLESHLAEPVTLADAAQAAGCSVHHFAHLFKSTLGLSPMRHLLKLRMQLALELVQTTALSMGEIGCRVGLPEPARFSQAFRAYWNAAPSALRRSARPAEGTS